MPSSVTYTFNNGDPIVASQHNTNFQDLINFDNGLASGTNIDAGAITTAKIQAGAITSSLLATGAVTSAKIAASITLTTPNIGSATGTTLNCLQAVIDHPSINQRTTSPYTLALSDDGIIIETNSASNIIITIPNDSAVDFPDGTRITVLRAGSGAATIQGDTGVTVNCTPQGGANTAVLRAQWSAATLLKRNTNLWVVMGDLSA